MTPWSNLRVPGHDGTALAVDIHLPPEQTWPLPVVVTRTPYGRAKHLAEGRGWRQHGFAYVVGDVRGRYDSDGCWEPYRGERADGAALVDWITAQPWCEGRLIPYGGSYSAYTAWAMAVERPDAVAAVVSLGPSMSLTDTKFDPSGVLRLGEHAAWWLERAESRTSRDGLARLVFAEQPDLLDHLPVTDLADRLGARLPHWADLLTGEDGSELITDSELAHLPAAAMHVGGWYDLLLPESLQQWQLAGSAHTPRPPRRMVIGPWGHELAFGTDTVVGDRDHGPAARMGFDQLCLNWLDAVLHGTPPSDQAEIFTVGSNTWTSSAQWPNTAAETVLHTNSGARLSPVAVEEDGAEDFQYDPLHPFPSRRPGVDRADTQTRQDAVRFATPPLTEAWTIVGGVEVDLVASTDAPTLDWTVRLLEQCADGRFFEIASGTAVDAVGGLDRRTIVLSPTAIMIAAGSALVVEITASDFPDLARNLGTSADRYTTTATRVCTQQVRWGPAGSTVRLPQRTVPA